MAAVTKQEYMRVLGEHERLNTKFMALEQENQRLLGDLQQVNVEKAQQQEELTQSFLDINNIATTSITSIKFDNRTQDKPPVEV